MWKAHPKWPKYEVSNRGEVRSWVLVNRPRGTTTSPKVLVGNFDKEGQRRVKIHDGNGGVFVRGVHVLVLETFVGPRPEGFVACHGPNGNTDDSLANLEWGTRSKNQGDDRRRDGTMPNLKGENSGRAKWSDADVLGVRQLAVEGYTTVEIATRYGMSRNHAWKIITRKIWTHI